MGIFNKNKLSIDGLNEVLEKSKKYDELIKFEIDKELHCSFCGKSQSAVKRLITNKGVNICNECVDLCKEIMDEEIAKDEKESKADDDLKDLSVSVEPMYTKCKK